ncbi:MAG: DUF2062 domain-containing protein [Opitutales bacterium]
MKIDPQATYDTPLTQQERLRLRKARHKRIRQVKAILRYLPRRASLHRYPVIKWFHKSALKRAYLWSFKTEYVANAIFWGCILAFLPIVGIQIFTAFFLAVFVRGNLPVMIGLQWISNPGTMVPIYFASYKIGDVLFRLIGARPESSLGDEAINEQITQASSSLSSLIEFAQQAKVENLLYLSSSTILGGFVVGLAIGTVLSQLYKAGFRFGIKKIPRSGLTLVPFQQQKEKAPKAPSSTGKEKSA